MEKMERQIHFEIQDVLDKNIPMIIENGGTPCNSKNSKITMGTIFGPFISFESIKYFSTKHGKLPS